MHFGGVRAVDGVSFEVPAGAVAGLIGPNGAGKTTMFNVITGVLAPTAGDVRLGDASASSGGISGCSDLGVARTFQTPRAFSSLSVIENVEVMYADRREGLWGALFGSSRRKPHRDQAAHMLERVGLLAHAQRSVDELSGGELRMLEIARQLAREPRLFLLDEPTAGLHPGLQERLAVIIAELNEAGTTVLLVEHNLRFLFENVRQVHVMSAGRLLASGDPTEIANDESVINAYLGRSHGDAVVNA
jgi:branched-chain amino acid transport system ATP-binding protein/branched-chain amino acid transport system permease protein